MPAPISGDKIFTQYDTKPTRREDARTETARTESRAEPQAKRPADDSVELHQGLTGTEAAPPNNNIGSAEQAREALGNLLAALQRDPDQAAAAHGFASQSNVDAAMAMPAG